ncbi:MAG: S26 family signal peptidase [Hyphomicrobiales bacterium]|nr:S26 family signal peptidase [Hyphomicrobiales bacterium]
MTGAGWLCAGACAVIAVAVPANSVLPKLLLWNASASVPIGLYTLRPADNLEIADLVVAAPPEPLAAYLAERGYLAPGVPLLKRVAALPGQKVCRSATTISVDGIPLGHARGRDGSGRVLPTWQGCRALSDAEVFLMNWQATDSFDGRYVGPIPRSAIVARAVPLWTDEAGDGRFVWRAATR